MKIIKFIIPLSFILFNFVMKAQVDEQTKFNMFCAALENNSTAPNYIVVIVKNLKTGEKKEICTEAPFIEGAMGHETGNWTVNCNKYKTRYFEFSKDSALMNISFNLRSKADFDKYAKTINVSDIVQKVKSGKLTSKTFTDNRKEQIMFAHLMFNNGVMMTRGCIAGNICELTYFKAK